MDHHLPEAPETGVPSPTIVPTTDEVAPLIVTIPVHASEALSKRMAALGKRAVRLGVKAPSAEIIAGTRRMEKQQHTYAEEVRGDFGATMLKESDATVYSVEVQDWKVAVEAVKLPDDYRYCGRIEHTERGNALFCAAGAKLDDKWRSAPCGCSHCNTQRDRADTFIVEDSAGQQVQVGRNCLRDFFSGRTASFLAQQFEFQSNIVTLLDEFAGESFGRFGRLSRCHDPEAVLAQAANVIRRNGFVSRAKASEAREYGEKKEATADAVSSLLALAGTPMWESVREEEKPIDDDRRKAAEILGWMSNLADDPANPFLTQLAVIGRQGFIAESQIGIACASYSAREREQRAKVRVERPDCGHFGVVGKRVAVDVEVDHVVPLDSDNFGPRELVKMHVIDGGQELAWFTSAGSFAEKGRKYGVKLTPARHEDYKGRKQTQVKRVACVREIEAPSPPDRPATPEIISAQEHASDEPPPSPAAQEVAPADLAVVDEIVRAAKRSAEVSSVLE